VPLAVGNMAQPEDVRRCNIVEGIICMSITYHRMEYNQRLQDDLLGEFNQTARPATTRNSAMRTYDNIRFLEFWCKSSTDVLERSVITVGCCNNRVQILHTQSVLRAAQKTETRYTLVFGAADFGLHASLTILSKFMADRRRQVPASVWRPTSIT